MTSVVTSAMSGPGMKFLTLDGMRGVAALAVVMWHAEALTGFRPLSGYLAVDLFFVLSGFVIAHSYERRLDGGMGPVEFMRVRFIRLYPLYFAGLALAAAALLGAMLIGVPTGWTLPMVGASFALSLFYLPTPESWGSNGALFPLNPPAWSLFFELLINIGYAVAYRWLGLRLLALVALSGAMALILLTLRYGDLNTGFFWSTALGGFPRVFFSFAIGVILLRLFRAGRLSANFGSFVPMVVTLAVLCYGPPAAWRAAYDLFAALVVFPLLTLAGASSQPARGTGIYKTLGLASYPMYVLHVPLMAIVISGLTKVLKVNVDGSAPWMGFAVAGIMLVLSCAAALVYDEPVRKKLTQWLTTSRRSSVGIPAE